MGGFFGGGNLLPKKTFYVVHNFLNYFNLPFPQ